MPKANAQSFDPPLVCDGRTFMSLRDPSLVVDGVTYNSVALFELVQSGLSFASVPLTAPSGVNYNSTAYNIQDGYLYAGFNNQIWRIKADGTLDLHGTPGGSFRSGYVGDIDDNNTYYLQSGNSTSLHVVDLANPNTFTVLPITVNGSPYNMRGADIAFNPRDGFLYVKSRNDTILKIDRSTGVSEVLDTVASSPNNGAGGSWFDAAGFFYNYFNAGSIYRYDIENPNASGEIPATFHANAFRVRTNDGAACAYRPTVTKTVSPNPGTPGQPVTYDFKISNVMPVDVTLDFSDSLTRFPGGTWEGTVQNCQALDSAGASTPTFCAGLTPVLSNGDTSLAMTGLEIPQGGSLSFELEVETALTGTPTSVCNQAELRNVDPDGTLYDPRFSSLVLLSDDPGLAGLEDETCHSFGTVDLSCSLTDNSGGLFTPGTSSIITLQLENAGTAPVSQIRLIEILQSGGTINTSTFAPNDIQCTALGQNANTTCGSQIVAADRQSYELRDLGLSSEVGGNAGALELQFPIAFSANFSGNSFTFDPNITIGGQPLSALCDAHLLNATPKADLEADKASHPDEAAFDAGIDQLLYTPGAPTTYAVRVRNNGPSNAVGASWVDELPASFTFDSFDFECDCLNSGSCTATAGLPNASNVVSGNLNLPASCDIYLLFEGDFETD